MNKQLTQVLANNFDTFKFSDEVIPHLHRIKELTGLGKADYRMFLFGQQENMTNDFYDAVLESPNNRYTDETLVDYHKRLKLKRALVKSRHIIYNYN